MTVETAGLMRRIEIVKWIIPVVFLFALTPICLAAEKDEKQKQPQSIDELRQQLEKVLAEAHTPGLSVAVVHRDRPEWIAGLGKAEVVSGRATTAETLFRIGSTSKGFASLSILMLADQGKLSLNDPVHKLAPEVWFENRWEASDPVRVVHLLEHTTGWDDIHLREYAKDAPGRMGLREALDYDHHSRTSRWRPGTRMAYCNSGPAVAAYIVEKLTGQRFEDFVEQNFFRPRDEDSHIFRASPWKRYHSLPPRRQDSLSLPEHPFAARGIDQCLRQRHGGLSSVLSESRRGEREADCPRLRH